MQRTTKTRSQLGNKTSMGSFKYLMCVCCYAHLIVSHCHFQTELAVTNHMVVSEIHRNVLKGLEGANNQDQLVSNICTPSHHQVNNQSPLSRFRPGQQSQLNIDPANLYSHLAYTEYPHLHHQESSLAVRS